jgi:nitrogen fixation protein NifX
MDTPHLRIAIATNSLVQMDANFAAARQMAFYDVSSDTSEFVDVVQFTRGTKKKKGPGGGKGCVMDDMGDDDGTGRDPLVERVEALKGCSVLFSLGLSDLAAVRVNNLRIFPVKSEKPRDIDEVIAQLQKMMTAPLPPLWMRRVMRDASGSRMPLDAQEI